MTTSGNIGFIRQLVNRSLQGAGVVLRGVSYDTGRVL